ncbi:hypothetical protein [Nocardia xishanensis]
MPGPSQPLLLAGAMIAGLYPLSLPGSLSRRTRRPLGNRDSRPSQPA